MSDTIIDLRQAPESLLHQVLALNGRYEAETSTLVMDRLRGMLSSASFCPSLEDGKAFLIAFRDTAAYDGASFRWLQREMCAFVYIDRIIVSAEAQGRGLGRHLYEHVEAQAVSYGFRALTCEVNLEPLNERSLAFHQTLGFSEIGRGTTPNGKTVCYLRKSI